MPKPEKTGKPDKARGQQKVHEVTNPDGTTVEMTQEDWRNRDKSLGQTRPDDEPETVEPDPIPAPI